MENFRPTFRLILWLINSIVQLFNGLNRLLQKSINRRVDGLINRLVGQLAARRQPQVALPRRLPIGSLPVCPIS